MISPFEYCTKCGLVYCHIQNFECVVCHGELAPIEGLIPERNPTKHATDTKPRNAQEEIYLLGEQLAANHAKLQKALRK